MAEDLENITYDSAEKGFSCFDSLSMNGKSSMFSMCPPFALSSSKGERRVFQQNHISGLTPLTDYNHVSPGRYVQLSYEKMGGGRAIIRKCVNRKRRIKQRKGGGHEKLRYSYSWPLYWRSYDSRYYSCYCHPAVCCPQEKEL